MIQSCWAAVGARSLEISGSAKLSTVLSIETRSAGSMSTASAIQARRGARPWAAVAVAVAVAFRRGGVAGVVEVVGVVVAV